MSKLGLQFVSGQILKNAELNLMVDAINDNDSNATSAKQLAEKSTRDVNELKQREVNISESEFEELQASGNLDPSKTYYIYEEE